jgi:hypothetical protein
MTFHKTEHWLIKTEYILDYISFMKIRNNTEKYFTRGAPWAIVVTVEDGREYKRTGLKD